jgi:hypothetical protein
MDRKTAAAYLRVSKTTLDRLDVPKAKIRKRVFFKKSVIDNWLEDQIKKHEVQNEYNNG